jgi:DNA repair exonuclease SbcCD ATPase subunit
VTSGQVLELAKLADECSALVFAPHCTAKRMGLFASGVCSNSKDVAKSPLIMAFDVVGSSAADVLTNPKAQFGDTRPRWFISGDTRSLADVGKRAIYLKLGAEPTLEGIRQAFLVPDTRVRFPASLQKQWGHVEGVRFLSSPDPSWPRMTGIQIRGGFHSDLALNFAPGLNAIIGGKGTGKSTLVEVLRYVLDGDQPISEEAADNRKLNFAANADAEVGFVDGEGDAYQVRRSGGEPAPRLLRGGKETQVPVRRRVSLRVFGQRELQDLAKRKDFLREFVASEVASKWETALAEERGHLAELGSTDTDLDSLETALAGLNEHASELADIRDKLGIAAEKGFSQLIQQSKELGSVNRSVMVVSEWPTKVATSVEQLAGNLPTPKPSAHPLMPEAFSNALTPLEEAVTHAINELPTPLEEARQRLREPVAEWMGRHASEEQRLHAALADAGIADPAELAELQGRASHLEGVVSEHPAKEQRHGQLTTGRADLLQKLNETRRQKSRLVEEASRDLNRRVGVRVRVQVRPMGDHSQFQTALEEALKSQGVRKDQIQRLSAVVPGQVADAIRKDAAELEKLGCSASTAAKLLALTKGQIRKLEETDVPDDIAVEIDLGERGTSRWTDVVNVSPGQRATALLAVALTSGAEPLIIDQPEDDLDNRYIYDEVVKVLGETCQTRQVIVATHNANIPILGDAELIVAFDADAGRSRVLACGGLEMPQVAEEARRILEGGDEAFRARQRRYQAAAG